ncbi:unnamed protein product (macronuclear) [Paramecium tetraurelia]|uniref:Uncharacterized protein n=1 Tax=Paramecium tetraurelia TaxID=5888 RepID=A0E1Y6_PARTE|nr:uncharacterized protein GSPATT00022474001 [Paramecium tetraurelia]CAK89303.1 unnamed protein product [Paramecium tetraurelia]|eukprot:XP_001456700.1 hypothetical protein (macronuclear) [Paramecium tetraurelia strain d4-2]
MKDSEENKGGIKCQICKNNPVTLVLVNKRILDNQRLLCDRCYHSYKGSENSKSYQNLLGEVHQKNELKEIQRKTIADQQIKSIKILLQLLNSYKDDLMNKIDNLVYWVNQWIKIIEKIKNDHQNSNFSDEIDSLLFPNYIQEQMEVLMFKRRIKYWNFQYCNQFIIAIQNFANASKLQESYKLLVDALFSIEQKIETKPSDIIKALNDKTCPLHQETINRVYYQNLQNPIGILCNSCENKYGEESLETFGQNWSKFLKKKEGGLEKFNQFLKEKIKQNIEIQIKNQVQINSFYNKGINNLVQTGSIELQKQFKEIEELKIIERDLKIEIMISSILQFNNLNNLRFDQNRQENQIITHSNPIIQIDTILKEQIKKNSPFLDDKSNFLYDVNFDLALYGPVQWKLVSQCENENCTVIAINSSKQLMVTNQGNKINIYQLKYPNQENQLKQLSWEKKLQVHKQHNELSITCMIHSKQYNSFVTADEQLVIWKYCDKIDVCQQLVIEKQNGYINCLIINKNETQLFSGGKQIQVYHLNFETYSVKYEYSLIEHKEKVLSLSLNDSETYLISYSADKLINIWFKGEKKWIIKQSLKINLQEYSNTISFIKNDLFILVTDLITHKKNIISFYKKTGSDNPFQEQVKEQLQIKYQSEDDKKNLDQPGFPIIQIENKNLIFIKNRNYIYTIRQELDGLYETTQKIMEFSSSSIFGNSLYIPEKNELYLVIWDKILKTYQIMI